MKIRTIIVIIVGLALAITGLVFTSQAKKQAETEAIQLFETEIDGNLVISEPAFNDSTVAIITINALDTDVFITGGSEDSHIEFVNFDPNLYVYSLSGKNITISELKDIDSLLEFWKNGLAFKGMRNLGKELLGFYRNTTRKKEIHIFLSDEAPVTTYDININNGNLVIENMKTASDYIFRCAEGSVQANNVTSASKIEVISKSTLNLSLERVTVSTLLINSVADKNNPVTSGTFNIKDSLITDSDIALKEGSVDIVFTTDPYSSYEGYSFSFVTNGAISFKGIASSSPFTRVGMNHPLYHYTLNIVSDNATIAIK